LLDKVCVKGGLKVHPSRTSVVTLLGKQDICNKVVPIEEPLGVEDVENIKHGRLIGAIQSSI